MRETYTKVGYYNKCREIIKAIASRLVISFLRYLLVISIDSLEATRPSNLKLAATLLKIWSI